MFSKTFWSLSKKLLSQSGYNDLRNQYFFKRYSSLIDLLLDGDQETCRALNNSFINILPFIPFYRNHIRNSWVEEDFEKMNLSSIVNNFPILNKESMVGKENIFINPNLSSYEIAAFETSGSTGNPTKVYQWLFSLILNETILYRSMKKFNLPNKHINIAYINMLDNLIGHHYGEKKKPYYSHTRYSMNDSKVYVLNFIDGDKDRIKQIAKLLVELKIDVISTTPGIYNILLDKSDFFKLDDKTKIKLSISSGQDLDVITKNKIESFFNTPVMNVYASEEGGVIATSSGNSHLNIDNHILQTEILNPTNNKISSKGKGILIITPAANHAMPLVRFNTCDVVDLHIINGQRVIRKLLGRSENYFTTLKGNKFNPALNPNLILDTGIKQIQFIQNTINHIMIKFVATKDISEDHRNNLTMRLNVLMEGNVKIDFYKVECITPPYKKHQISISKV